VSKATKRHCAGNKLNITQYAPYTSTFQQAATVICCRHAENYIYKKEKANKHEINDKKMKDDFNEKSEITIPPTLKATHKQFCILTCIQTFGSKLFSAYIRLYISNTPPTPIPRETF